MSEANKDEADKCKKVAIAAREKGDLAKSLRMLRRSSSMYPTPEVDALIAEVQAQLDSGESATPSAPNGTHEEVPRRAASESSTGRSPTASRTSTSGQRVGKNGKTYTSEQFQAVQKILRTKDYYELLGVPRDASEDHLKKAYRKLAVQVHPDKNGAPGADEAFKKVSKCFQCLTDKDDRASYDRFGEESESRPTRRGGHRQHHRHEMTPEDLFAAFFGGGVPQHHQGEGAPQARLFQLLPIFLILVMTLMSNLTNQTPRQDFSFEPAPGFEMRRHTQGLNVPYFVPSTFSNSYPERSTELRQFDNHVDIYHIRALHSECDWEEKKRTRDILQAKRRGNKQALEQIRKTPLASCEKLSSIKAEKPRLWKQAFYPF
mmetsp:Transcript_84638/g.226224  ORF Transcript_84638/g.226224 Transcript_84638/m.226224 type:complete len:375 (-) Transcript_84638:51-1175(-)